MVLTRARGSSGPNSMARTVPPGPPPLVEGQGAPRVAEKQDRAQPSSSGDDSHDLSGLGLPSDPGAIVRYFTHRYKGVGEKTAVALVDALGTEVFNVMQSDPDRIAELVPAGRADQVLSAWKADYERRTSK